LPVVRHGLEKRQLQDHEQLVDNCRIVAITVRPVLACSVQHEETGKRWQNI